MKEIEIGFKRGRLTITKYIGVQCLYGRKTKSYLAECECGGTKVVYSRNFFRKKRPPKSCGCLASDRTKEVNTIHGMRGSKEYRSWSGMKDRCLNPSSKDYDRYGGRGVNICSRWIKSFESFYLDMGSAPSKDHSIDRKNNSRGYGPKNCRWATPKEQARNRRGNVIIVYKGEKITASEADEMNGFYRGTVARRIKKWGWSVNKAVETPTKTSIERSSK